MFETAFNDKEKLPLWGDKVGSYNNPPHILIFSNIGLEQSSYSFLMLVTLGTVHSRRGNNELHR